MLSVLMAICSAKAGIDIMYSLKHNMLANCYFIIMPICSFGYIVGGLFAGLFVDRFGARNTLSCSTIITALISFIVIFPTSTFILSLCFFVRGVAISFKYNASFNSLKILYKDADIRRKQTNYFYTIFYGSGIMFPIISSLFNRYLSMEILFLVLGIWSILAAYLVYKNLPSNYGKLNANYIKNFIFLIKNNQFRRYCIISAIMTGGHYGMLSVICSKVSFNQFQFLQSFGRACVALSTAVTVNYNINLRYMSLCIFSTTYLMLQFYQWIGLSMIIIILFVFCCAAGASQPQLKAGMINICVSLESEENNITGTGQSLITTSNSVFQMIMDCLITKPTLILTVINLVSIISII